jgi:hypothetical protein
MAARSTTSEYQPIPPYLRVMRGFGGSRNGGRQGRICAFASSTGTNGARVKGNIMASGGPGATALFHGGTARGAMKVNPKANGTGD